MHILVSLGKCQTEHNCSSAYWNVKERLMAKKDKKDKKASKKKKAEKKMKAQLVGAAIEAKSFDVAHRIWLAGVGAYGKAYDVATDGLGNVSGQSSALFDELVARGEEIENDIRARLTANTTVAAMTKQMSMVSDKAAEVRERVQGARAEATEAVVKFQEEQRERLEARMERMREALGLKALSGKASKTDKLHSKLDKLEEQVAELQAESADVDDAAKARVERLTSEIAAFGKKSKKAAKKAKKSVKSKTETVAETLPVTDEMGRLSEPLGEADDLKLIKGVGVVLERKLNAAGIFHFWQLAGLTEEQIAGLEAEMRFPGRIVRDAWQDQARGFIKQVAN